MFIVKSFEVYTTCAWYSRENGPFGKLCLIRNPMLYSAYGLNKGTFWAWNDLNIMFDLIVAGKQGGGSFREK